LEDGSDVRITIVESGDGRNGRNLSKTLEISVVGRKVGESWRNGVLNDVSLVDRVLISTIIYRTPISGCDCVVRTILAGVVDVWTGLRKVNCKSVSTSVKSEENWSLSIDI
jgi:hypothetical protein